jgi:hypothetical protein
MLRAFVVHWDEAGLAAKVDLVAAAGVHVVGAEHADAGAALRQVKDLKPDVLVVWLDKRPGHGRVTAAAIRSYAWAGEMAVLFVDQDPDPLPKESRSLLGEVLPDAIVATPATLAVWLAKIEKAKTERLRPVPEEPSPSPSPSRRGPSRAPSA